jgi:hypothetical protein
LETHAANSEDCVRFGNNQLSDPNKSGVNMSLVPVERLSALQNEMKLTPAQRMSCNKQGTQSKHQGRQAMIRTIAIGKYITAQGVFIRALPNGHIVIKAGTQELSGLPVSKRVA